MTLHRNALHALLIDGLKRDALPMFIAVFFFAAVWVTLLLNGMGYLGWRSHLSNLVLTATGIFFSFSLCLLWLLATKRPGSPVYFIKNNDNITRGISKLIAALPVLFAINLFSPAFSAAKRLVGTYVPYIWDASFIKWDVALHGTDAWRVINPVTGIPEVTFALSLIYQLWVLLLYVALPMIAIFMQRGPLRTQFLCTYLMSWILLGALLANFWSSVGPCFLEAYTGSDHFKQLTDQLLETDKLFPILALDVQSTLLQWQKVGGDQLGQGISAMPSMHVSIATVFTLVAWRFGRIWRTASSLFWFAIMLGSVQLAYHYAVDGYVSAIITIGIWKGVGWLISKNRAGWTQ